MSTKFAVTIVLAGLLDASAQGILAPLSLFINGGGTVSPLTNGQPLEIGQTYNIAAIPEAGFTFRSWQPVDLTSSLCTLLMRMAVLTLP